VSSTRARALALPRGRAVIAEFVVWACVAVLGYVYLGYPLLVMGMSRIAGSPIARARIRPTVTVIIAAYNEEKSLRAKLDSVLGLEYPKGLLEVIVASDTSSDATDAIVRAYATAPVQLLRLEGRQGKTACQNAAADRANGEILVFTDATTRIAAGAVTAFADDFADATVGCVAGLLV
jgi:cellulose synthase/poly-beta-1,6-N-acetylglucosamine synthase-like glycosyltransferase